MKASILVTHERQPVALVNARHTTLLGPAAELPPGHPRLRPLMHLTYYGQLVARGHLPGPYRDEDAERFATEAVRRCR